MKTEKHKNENLKNFFNKNLKLESQLNISYYTQDKFDFITKNKEMNTFKEEILSYLRERDSHFIEKINTLKLITDINAKKIEEFSEKFENNYNSILTKQIELGAKFEKIKSYDSFMNKANDKLISQEIRLNNIKDDLNKTCQKYDKIYLDNLIVPGFVGQGAKFSNCKLFFSYVIKELDKLNIIKEKNVLDLSSYKEKLENMIKSFQFLVDNYNNSHIKYITKLNEQTNKNILEIIGEKINNLRIENSHFSMDLIKKSNELNSLYDKIKIIQNNIMKEFNNILQEYNNKIEENHKSFNQYKSEQNEINKKLISLSNLFKVEKISKNLGFQLGLRRNKDLNNLKGNYEQNENNKIKNLFEIKQNIISKRLSKSQNNFNINNNNNNIINFHKKIYITENPRKLYLKKNRNSIDSIFNYSRTSSVKSFNKENKNILRYNLKLKGQKLVQNEMPLINTSKSQRNNQTTLYLIKNLKKEKKLNYEELTDMKNINSKEDDISLLDSALSNMNNSINTYSTTNENNNTLNNLNTKIDGFGLVENDKNKDIEKDSFDEPNDKIIKEIASELEQSTAKGKILCSNKKDIEKNFKSICDKIQPINLKLNNQKKLEKIDELGEKNINNNFSIKSENNNTILNNNKMNINYFNINQNGNETNIKNRLKNSFESNEKIGENNENKNIILNKKLEFYDNKLINLESITNDKYFELINQINLLKKNFTILAKVIKKEKKMKILNSKKIQENKNINNTSNSVIYKRGNKFLGNESISDKENINTLNLTSKCFNNKKPLNIEISSKISSLSKNFANKDDTNLSQGLFHNGKYYTIIKDIFGQKKFEAKKLLNSKNIDKEIEDDSPSNNNNNLNANIIIDKKDNN